MITSESEIVYGQVLSKLPILRRYAEIDVNEKQYLELVEILDQFTMYVINMYLHIPIVCYKPILALILLLTKVKNA